MTGFTEKLIGGCESVYKILGQIEQGPMEKVFDFRRASLSRASFPYPRQETVNVVVPKKIEHLQNPQNSRC
jgi:hypothetical protein